MAQFTSVKTTLRMTTFNCLGTKIYVPKNLFFDISFLLVELLNHHVRFPKDTRENPISN